MIEAWKRTGHLRNIRTACLPATRISVLALPKMQSVAAIYILTALLAACGFSPVYQAGNKTGEAMREISLADPNSEVEFKFLPHMQRKFPQANLPTMKMDYEISLSERELVARANAIDASMSYNIISLEGGSPILVGQVFANTTYTTSSSIVGDMVNEASRDLAIDRLGEMLSQAAYHEIIAKLSAVNNK